MVKIKTPSQDSGISENNQLVNRKDDNKVGLTVRGSVAKRLRVLAAMESRTMNYLMEEALDLLFQKYAN